MQSSYRAAPGFLAALGGAFVGYIAGVVLAVLFLWPFAIASSTALAVGSAGGYHGLGRLVLAALFLVLAQIAITALLTQHAASLLGDAPVRFRRALALAHSGDATEDETELRSLEHADNPFPDAALADFQS